MAGDRAGDTTDLTDSTPPERPHKIRKTHGDIHGLLHVDQRDRDNREDIREAAVSTGSSSGRGLAISTSTVSDSITVDGGNNRSNIPSSEADSQGQTQGEGVVPNNSGTNTPPKRTRDMDQKIS